MDANGADPRAHFVGKWRQREPDMELAEVFCPGEGKQRFQAWGALLHELRETLFELSDSHVTAAKTGWWAEEMIGVGQGRQRHPLTEVLLAAEAEASAGIPWSQLGRALLDYDVDSPRADDTAHAVALLLPTASAVIAVEAAMFRAQASAEAARSLAVHWLLQRLLRGRNSADLARIPMHLFARHGVTPAQLATESADALVRDWGRELLQAMPADVAGAALIRRSRHRFDQGRLAQLAAGKGLAEPSAPLTLWRAWRAAQSR